MTTKFTDKEERAIKQEMMWRASLRAALVSKFDANDTPFLERQIVQLRTRTFEVEFAPTIARQFGPVASDIAAYADLYSYAVYETVGAAKIGSYASKDVPRVERNVREVFGKVVPIVDAYGWNIGEMAEAARLGMDLTAKKLVDARSAIERGIDKVLAFGSIEDETATLPDVGLTGLVNNAAVVANGITALGFWTGGGVTSDVILSTLSSMVSTVNNRTNGAYAVDTLLLPTAILNYIQQKPYSTLNGESVLSIFKKNNPQITMVAPWWKLNTAGAAGVPRAVAYQRNAEILELVIPLDFTSLPPEAQTFEMVVNCHARCGGTKIYRPFAVQYADFATS